MSPRPSDAVVGRDPLSVDAGDPRTTAVADFQGGVGEGQVSFGSAAFFICIGDQPALDAGATRNPDRQGFAAFGRVLQGMDVVRRFHAAPTHPAKGGDCVRGQLLAEPVTIAAARRWP